MRSASKLLVLQRAHPNPAASMCHWRWHRVCVSPCRPFAAFCGQASSWGALQGTQGSNNTWQVERVHWLQQTRCSCCVGRVAHVSHSNCSFWRQKLTLARLASLLELGQYSLLNTSRTTSLQLRVLAGCCICARCLLRLCGGTAGGRCCCQVLQARWIGCCCCRKHDRAVCCRGGHQSGHVQQQDIAC